MTLVGADLVSACVFCGGLLLAGVLPEPSGPSAEVAFTYATLGRRNESSDLTDSSRVTARFLSLGLGMARPAREGLGAGTPEWEWRLKFALAAGSDDQTQETRVAAPRTQAAGRGRYENYLLLYRQPLGKRDSIEVAWSGRSHTASGAIEETSSGLREQRALTAERNDASVGWRHRWPDLEVLIAVGYVQPSGTYATAATFSLSDGKLPAGTLAARWRRGPWSVALAGERASGTLDVSEQSAPNFFERDSSGDASLDVGRIGAGWTGRRMEVFLSGSYERSRLPFVSLAALGREVEAFEAGLHPDSRAHEFQADLTLRYTASAALRPLLAVRWARGTETVTLTEPAGGAAPREISVRRAGRLLGRPFGDVTLSVGAQVSVPAGR